MAEFGIWSSEAGGMIEQEFCTRKAAEDSLEHHVTVNGETREELEIVEVCEYHPDQIATDCEDCAMEGLCEDHPSYEKGDCPLCEEKDGVGP